MAPEKKPLTSREKKIQAQRIILKIIEQMLEEDLPKEWFLKNCSYLCQADYDDVIQERSIVKLCGYPLCSKPIKMVPKQQYHICKAANKVYDITERKNFCSNECYKASNFLKSQLHSLPLYMRKIGESSLKIKVLSDSDNKGSAGEEILFHHTISKNEIEKTSIKSQVTTNLANVLQEDIKDCTEHLTNLEIKEKVYKDTYVFGTEEPSENLDNGSDSNEEAEFSDHSDNEDKSLFPDYDNLEVISNKHMPVSNSKKKVLLIDPVKPIEARPSNQNSTELSIDFISNVFQDWFTEDTMKYLLGERRYYSIKADQLFKRMVCSEDDKSEKLSTVKDEYIKLCLKIDKLPEGEEELSDDPEINTDVPVKKTEEAQRDLVKIAAETDASSPPVKTNPKRRPKRKGKSKNKSVSFAPGTKDRGPINTHSEDSDSKCLPEPAFPLVDSISQNTLRKQVLTSRLKSVYFDLLAIIGLHYRNIKEEVKDIVNTFSLTPNNIIFKPKQLKCIGIVLFRILTKTAVKEFDDDAQFTKLCENALAGLSISEHEINNLVFDLISPDQVLRLQNVVQ